MLIRTKNKLQAFCALLFASLAAIFPSCNRETPQNMEADILTFMIAEDGHLMEVASSDNVINYYLSQYHSLDSLNAVVTLSENATISPDPATVHDFSQPVTFTVVSQDRQWNRIYTVNVINTSLVYNGDFEEWQGTGSGNNFYETPVGWTSANSGVRIIHGMGVPNLEFPTVKTDNAYSGNFAVSLNTRQGGQTSLVPRLIAGSIFLGTMSNVTLQSLANPLLLTKFGIPYTATGSRPDSLIGYLRYTPGPTYTDRNGNVDSNAVDSCSFYAVLFEGSEPLDGTNSTSSERIVAIAQYKYETPISSTTYTRIALPFVYRREMPQNTTLQYSIIASSSAKGDLYQGAAGSQLLLDKVEIKLKQSEK